MRGSACSYGVECNSLRKSQVRLYELLDAGEFICTVVCIIAQRTGNGSNSRATMDLEFRKQTARLEEQVTGLLNLKLQVIADTFSCVWVFICFDQTVRSTDILDLHNTSK